MKVDKNLVSRLEKLSLLSFSEEEKQRLIPEFNNLIKMIDKLQDTDTEGVEPLLHINNHIQKLRKDVAGDMLDRQKALDNAAESTDRFFKVPKVIKRS